MLLGEPRPPPGQARSLLPTRVAIGLLAHPDGRQRCRAEARNRPGLMRASREELPCHRHDGIEPRHLADTSTRTATPTGSWRSAPTLAYDIEDIRMRVRSVAGERHVRGSTCAAWLAQAGQSGSRCQVSRSMRGLATTESRSRRADRVLALAAARRGDLTGRGHEDGKKWTRVIASV